MAEQRAFGLGDTHKCAIISTECSSITSSANRRGPPPGPRAGPGFAIPMCAGRSLLKKAEIQAAIGTGEDTAAMPPAEVLARVADIACADMLDFVEVDKSEYPRVNLRRVRRPGTGHLLRRLRTRKDGTVNIELEPRLPALIKLGDYYKLWKGEDQQQLTLCDLAKGLKEKYELLRRRRDDEKKAGDNGRPAGFPAAVG